MQPPSWPYEPIVVFPIHLLGDTVSTGSIAVPKKQDWHAHNTEHTGGFDLVPTAAAAAADPLVLSMIYPTDPFTTLEIQCPLHDELL